MKTAVKVLALRLTVLAIIFSSCSKDGDIGPMGPQGLQGAQGPVGPQGPKGDTGEDGEDGNANVLSYGFTVAKADWPDPKHHGGNNVYSAYTIASNHVGGIDFIEFYDAGGVVLAYSQLSSPYNAGHTSDSRNVNPLPFVTNVSKGSSRFGVKIDLSARFGQLLLAKTTNGYDALNIPLEERPDAVDFRLVFIDGSVVNESTVNTPPVSPTPLSITGKYGREDILNQLKTAGVDVADYSAVMDYFGME